MEKILKIKKIKENAVLPQYMTKGSIGLDLSSTQEYNIKAGQQVLIKTGIALEIPYGYVGLVCSRSGLALKEGVFTLNSPGIVDPDYRGETDEVGVILYNTGSVHDEYHVKKGDRVAQLVLVPAPQFEIEEVDVLENNSRGGFGSTGKD